MKKWRSLAGKHSMSGIVLSAVSVFVFFLSGCATESRYVNKNYNNAKKLYARGQYAEALDYYQKYMSNHPDNNLNEVVYYYMGRCYEETGEPGKAKIMFETLIEKYKEGYWVERAEEKLETY